MYTVVGLNEKDVSKAESFVDAMELFHEHCIEPIARGQKTGNPETTCFIEAKGETATTRMYYPFVFEFAIKVGLIKNGKLVEPLIEPPTTELIAAFSRAAVMQMVGTLGCH
jgi:hypothetical protein